MSQRVAIVGMGQTHHKSRRNDVNGVELINEAVSRALTETDLTINDIDAIVIGNMDHFENVNYVDMWSIDGTGGYMKPVFKVTTGGTTGTTVGIAAYHLVGSGLFDVVLAIGWEKNSESDTTGAIVTFGHPIWDRPYFAGALPGLAVEASAYMKEYGITEKDAARVTVRDRKNALNNPYAHLRKEVAIQDVMDSPMLAWPIKLLDICPRTDGACALIYAGERKAKQMVSQPAWIWKTVLRHNFSYQGDVDYKELLTMREASKELFNSVGIKEPLKEIDVIELYQPYSFAGLKWIEEMGLCKPGESPRLLWDGVTDMDGEIPINPSGGVLSTNCIGATGLLRIGEAALQVMEKAEKRQVQDVDIALATGFGGVYWTDMVLLGREPW